MTDRQPTVENKYYCHKDLTLYLLDIMVKDGANPEFLKHASAKERITYDEHHEYIDRALEDIMYFVRPTRFKDEGED